MWFDPALAVAYRPRGGVRALARQYFDYGRWKRVVLARHPRSLKARQLAAPVLVLGLAGSAAAALAGALSWAGDPILATQVLAGAVALPGAWLVALATQSLATALRLRRPGGLAMAVPVAVMHLAWGVGFLMPNAAVPEDAGERTMTARTLRAWRWGFPERTPRPARCGCCSSSWWRRRSWSASTSSIRS